MKILTLIDHTGKILLELEVFVDGVDYEWNAPKPTAYWLGAIHLTNESLMSMREKILVDVEVVKQLYAAQEEKFYESKKACNQDTGDERINPSGKFDGVKDLSERRKRDGISKGN